MVHALQVEFVGGIVEVPVDWIPGKRHERAQRIIGRRDHETEPGRILLYGVHDDDLAVRG